MSALDRLVNGVLAAGQAAATSAWEVGTVVAITPGGSDGYDVVTVNWGGSEMPVGHGSTYTPAVGHVVWMARKGPQLMIVDRYVGAPILNAAIEGVTA